MNRILVLYGTTEGHTEQIATAIGNALTASGFDVNTIQAGTLDPRPADYDGIIVSASVHRGRYQKAVGNWIGAHVAELRDKPSAFVSACLGVMQHDPKVDAELAATIHQFIDPLGWKPTIIKAVAGALFYTRYNFLIRWIMKRIAAKAGGGTDTSRDYDYTDWDDLQVFAEAFGQKSCRLRRYCPLSASSEIFRARRAIPRNALERTLIPSALRSRLRWHVWCTGCGYLSCTMSKIIFARHLTTVLFATLIAAAANAQPSEPALKAFSAFGRKHTRDYVLMHRRLERRIGSIEADTPIRDQPHDQGLAAAIRAERVTAAKASSSRPLWRLY